MRALSQLAAPAVKDSLDFRFFLLCGTGGSESLIRYRAEYDPLSLWIGEDTTVRICPYDVDRKFTAGWPPEALAAVGI